MSYFPMFVELQNKKCLIVGGGKVAFRKIQVLLEFGADVTVVAPTFMEEIFELQQRLGAKEKDSVDVNRRTEKEPPAICICAKKFEDTDLEGMELVVAATDEKELNHDIAELCRKRGIPCNAVDQIEDCSFIFPAYVKEGEVVAAFSSGGSSPVITQYLKEEIKPVLNVNLGNLAVCLGALRQEVKETVETEAERKRFYQEVLQLGLQKDDVPTAEEIAAILRKYHGEFL